MPYLKLAAVDDERVGGLTLFALNRSLDEEMPLRRHGVKGYAELAIERRCTLRDPDLEAVNSKASPGTAIASQVAR